MNYAADLHIHSPFSRATSPQSDLFGLASWARIKGINVLGTGDFTHPAWLAALKTELVPAEPGFFALRDRIPDVFPLTAEPAPPSPVRFLLSAEISCIYKRHGKVRKVHNLLYVPDFGSAERINLRLAKIGNIHSDGRPILGLDSRDLLEIVLEEAPQGFLVPAHIWTPWFSLFGSRSGFDCIQDCFGDLTDHIFALETGLSSDPEMNRLISALDRFTLISNSDCHSPSKIGREANLFSAGFDYFSLQEALRTNNRATFRGTIEFFPEEGKYHADGHRACNVSLHPHQTRTLNAVCPVCNKPLTVGVLYRVTELADRKHPIFRHDAPESFSMIPLTEILSEILDSGPATKKVMQQYQRIVNRFGTELHVLMEADIDEIEAFVPPLGEAIVRMRSGKVTRKPGFDGEYGTIRVFAPQEAGEVPRIN